MAVKPTRPDIRIGTALYQLRGYRPWIVVGETSRSWVVHEEGSITGESWNPDTKIPKSGLTRGWTISEQEWKDECFARAHKWKISRLVEGFTPTQIRQIAALIGYEPEENGK